MEDYGFLKWTDISTSRWQSVYENLFGESLQFHRQHFLEDTLVGRPVFVKYDTVFNYIVEAVVLRLRYVHPPGAGFRLERDLYHGTTLYVCASHSHCLSVQSCPLAVVTTDCSFSDHLSVGL